MLGKRLGRGITCPSRQELLVTLARACRDLVRVRFRYAGRDDGQPERTVEPVRMVATSRRWYLMAWDVDRDGWRTFRLDRMREVAATWRFRPRSHPDPVAYVLEPPELRESAARLAHRLAAMAQPG